MARTLTVTPGTPSGLSWGGAPLEVWGVRVASAAAKDAWTEQLHRPPGRVPALRRQRPDRLLPGLVRRPACRPSRRTGGEIEPARAAAHGAPARAPAPSAGCWWSRVVFYQNQTARLDPQNALAARPPRPTREPSRPSPAPATVPHRDRQHLQRAHRAGRGRPAPSRCARWKGSSSCAGPSRRGDPDRLVGGGGGHPGVNAELAVRPEVDVLLWDWHHSPEAVAAYRAAGCAKPTDERRGVRGPGAGLRRGGRRPAPGERRLAGWAGAAAHQRKPRRPGRRRVQGVFPEQTEGPPSTAAGRTSWRRSQFAAAHARLLALRSLPRLVPGPLPRPIVRQPLRPRRPGHARRPRASAGTSRRSPGHEGRWHEQERHTSLPVSVRRPQGRTAESGTAGGGVRRRT